jgi:uncharacterized repeat protein (TIGR01451 family)
MPITFSTMAPEVLNTSNTVSFSLPIINTGSAPATNVFITDIHLDSATRLAPAQFPVFAGKLGVYNIIFANAKFSGDGFTDGRTHLITVRGTYQVQSVTYTFEVYRVLRIPAPTIFPVDLLQAHIDVTIDSGQWSYTAVNDEPHGSSQFINAVSLDIVAAVTVTHTPAGWQVLTDSASYVLWYVVDQRAPYPNHIAPGSSRAGFAIQSARRGSESTGFALTAWNHQTDAAGLVTFGAVSSPSRAM